MGAVKLEKLENFRLNTMNSKIEPLAAYLLEVMMFEKASSLWSVSESELGIDAARARTRGKASSAFKTPILTITGSIINANRREIFSDY